MPYKEFNVVMVSVQYLNEHWHTSLSGRYVLVVKVLEMALKLTVGGIG